MSGLLLDAFRPTAAVRCDVTSRPLEIMLVNAMPDAALDQTERQFGALIGRGANGCPVRLHLVSLPGIARGAQAQARIDARYAAFATALHGDLDLLIVSGTEPRAADLRDEPYWGALADLLDRAERDCIPTVLSCLAAHAAALHRDGIARVRLPEKRCGVFRHEAMVPHALTRGLPATFRVPHSRWNALPEAALVACGWRVLTRSTEAGADLLVRDRRNLLVCFQGHPEYEADTLLREYRRDVRRFLEGTQSAYPALPYGMFDEHDTDRLAAFRARAEAGDAGAMLASFPTVTVAAPAWQADAALIWQNLLGLAGSLHE